MSFRLHDVHNVQNFQKPGPLKNERACFLLCKNKIRWNLAALSGTANSCNERDNLAFQGLRVLGNMFVAHYLCLLVK